MDASVGENELRSARVETPERQMVVRHGIGGAVDMGVDRELDHFERIRGGSIVGPEDPRADVARIIAEPPGVLVPVDELADGQRIAQATRRK